MHKQNCSSKEGKCIRLLNSEYCFMTLTESATPSGPFFFMGRMMASRSGCKKSIWSERLFTPALERERKQLCSRSSFPNTRNGNVPMWSKE